jgi:hypothetical protein
MSPKALAAWKVEYLAETAALNNDDLFDRFLGASIPDGNDGTFTSRGLWEFETVQDELVRRLKGTGFLSAEFELEDAEETAK